MFDPHRLRGVAVAALSVAIFLGITERGVQATRPGWPESLQSDMRIWPMDGYTKAGGQIATIAGDPQSRHKAIGVLLGASTLDFAIDPTRLSSALGSELQ